MYSATVTWNYGDDYADVPLSVGVTDWEEISESEFHELRSAVATYNQNSKEKFKLVVIQDHNISAIQTLENYRIHLEEQNKKRQQEEAARKAEFEAKKTKRLEKKLNKDKKSKEALFEQLKKELQK